MIGATEDGGGTHAGRFVQQGVFDASAEEILAWHERPGTTERLTPPWEPVRVEQTAKNPRAGNRTILRTSAPGPLVLRWRAEHVDSESPRELRTHVAGPFATWEHRHYLETVDGGRSRLTDEVACHLPLPRARSAATWPIVQSRLRRIFGYRHRQLAADLAAHQRAQERGVSALRVAVSGASGLIGSQLVALLRSGGHEVTRLVRRNPAEPDEIFWDPDSGRIDVDRLRGLDAVVHLAGAPIGMRWTEENKRRIRDSRVDGTRLLAATLATMDGGPHVFICGSAIGFYGYDRGDEALTENADSGGGFLAEVVRQWETAADPAREAGLRVVHVRTGLVQSPAGGTLQLQLPLFWTGAGGRLGSGSQWMSWVSIDDIVGILHHALTTPNLHGPVNGTARHPVTNTEFTRILGRVLRRPTPLPTPKLGPALFLGKQGAAETAFASQRVLPAGIEQSGYIFRHPILETALRHILGR